MTATRANPGPEGPGLLVTLADLAARANPLRGAVRPGTEPGLESTAYFGPDRGSTASGVHALIVDVDPETATVQVRRYVVVHDCGTMINPMIVDGQVQGGVAHGIGNALFEWMKYDAAGQPLTTTFQDYLLPSAPHVPACTIEHVETPNPLNPLGVKGAGEGGTIPAPAAIISAIEDALAPYAVHFAEAPLTPDRIVQELAEAGAYDTLSAVVPAKAGTQ